MLQIDVAYCGSVVEVLSYHCQKVGCRYDISCAQIGIATLLLSTYNAVESDARFTLHKYIFNILFQYENMNTLKA